MKVLSIETTSDVGSVAFLEDNNVYSEYIFRTPDIASKLISSIDIILEDNRCKPEDLKLIVVSYGPGLWTGIRLGMGVAKGIAAGNKAKIFCIGAMDSIFFGIKEFKIPAICIINAYRGQVYLAYFNGKFVYKKNYPIRIVELGELYSICSKKEIILTGTGVSIIPDKIRKLKNVIVPDRQFLYPSAGMNGLLSLEKIHRGIPSAPLKPFYGR
ncbi:MAG: tRNA (adenosine(37)-N6)-threonylcarbamoyltransferase complex dimerization subunit type 1 TsaB [Candidatus Omnitrophica bacterium]|nr:tRNA (adenosine(37)-N6)-threonylcarbamoyltransferase complex dimerization subunit type 1 TsaB [Candidatus Omnitrophota bacterium]MCM8777303.1 tRNA (adenosine(37)-N6)-threonylcarbamoyltransferase complex dimerization subunit type 1 TsaB [Candidatus Omnitrophota bacterium]